MFFTRKKIFILSFVFVAISAGVVFYAADVGLFKPAKSSKIPAKRKFPVNTKIRPCVNFYEYACSPVISNFKLREDRSHHTFSFSDARERLLDSKKKYFARLAKKKPESDMERETKDYYLSCMNKEARKKEELSFVRKTKERLSKIKAKEEFLEMLAKNITDASRLSFIGFHADEPNLDRPKYNDLFFTCNLKSLPEKSYYKDEKLTEDLKLLIADFFTTIDEKSPKKMAGWVFNFEKELAKIYPTPHEFRERIVSRTKISRKKLIKNYPYLRLQEFLSGIPERTVIRNVIGNDTMNFLNKKLKTASLEELKSVYLYFQLSYIMDEAYPEYFNKRFEFSKKYLGGPNKRSDLQERCSRRVMRAFEKEVDFILLPKLFPGFPKEKFIKSIEKIRMSLMMQLKKNDWLSKSAKREAILKIKTADLGLVTPDNEEEWYFNPRSNYVKDAYIANNHKLSQLLMSRDLQDLNGPVSTKRWFMGPLTVNAYCHQNYNQVVFPVGILQYPFYDPGEPEEINLAAIGAVIGHELGHLIDNHGNKFDAGGRLRSWISSRDKKAFDKRSQYLITQFDEIGHNGKFTLGENIGDLVGVTTAYNAAFPPGSNKSQDLKRRFFLQYARIWCGIEREGVTKMRLKTDPHSLGCARVNEQMKHQKGFKEAYNCKPSDPMVLPDDEIVKIW